MAMGMLLGMLNVLLILIKTLRCLMDGIYKLTRYKMALVAF
jgi:hypothetical protein